MNKFLRPIIAQDIKRSFGKLQWQWIVKIATLKKYHYVAIDLPVFNPMPRSYFQLGQAVYHRNCLHIRAGNGGSRLGPLPVPLLFCVGYIT
jgi:hypothetical protein